MVEANENPQFVTMKRQRDLEESQQAYADRLVAQAVSAHQQTQSPLVVESARTTVLQPEPPPPSPEDAHATFRHVRLAIVALLVVVLIAVWFRQRRSLS